MAAAQPRRIGRRCTGRPRVRRDKQRKRARLERAVSVSVVVQRVQRH